MPRELLIALAFAVMTAPATAQTVRLHAAGSLRTALVEMSAAFEKTYGVRVEATFGASGRLRDEIAAGATAEVFASANMGHPQALAKTGRSGPVVLFARNRMCVLARPGLPRSIPQTWLRSCSNRKSSLRRPRRRQIPPEIMRGACSARTMRSRPALSRRWRPRRCNSWRTCDPRAASGPQHLQCTDCRRQSRYVSDAVDGARSRHRSAIE